ncbi:MAG: hypothetical protein H6Q87_1212, partial [candidate division NC10 bacterium]|nr:hypothetical protein [candidate division NC10 bacterium]
MLRKTNQARRAHEPMGPSWPVRDDAAPRQLVTGEARTPVAT